MNDESELRVLCFARDCRAIYDGTDANGVPLYTLAELGGLVLGQYTLPQACAALRDGLYDTPPDHTSRAEGTVLR